MAYLYLKYLHISCALLSLSGFMLRGIWMWQESPRLQQRWVKRLPHVIDSLLLGSAIALAVMSAQYPLQLGWLTAKVAALLVYILLGMVALKWGHNSSTRRLAWLCAIATFVYILGTARSRDACWPLSLLNL